jgi:hypothetical protein
LLLKVRQASPKLNKECISVNRILDSDNVPFSHGKTSGNNFVTRDLEANARTVENAGNAHDGEVTTIGSDDWEAKDRIAVCDSGDCPNYTLGLERTKNQSGAARSKRPKTAVAIVSLCPRVSDHTIARSNSMEPPFAIHTMATAANTRARFILIVQNFSTVTHLAFGWIRRRPCQQSSRR